MRKILLFALFTLPIATGLLAQTIVSSEPQNKNVVLEEFTGIHCQFCPDGHRIAQGISNLNPGRVVLINIHQGPYATPSGSEPDYRTSFGDPLEAQASIDGYPAATVNRHVFPGLGMATNGTGMSRGAWTTASDIILDQSSPVNVGVETSFVEATRLLTVNVELYYTANSATSSNSINVALLQDSILGPQTSGGLGNFYVHMHMLRHLITGQWGEVITTTTEGTVVNKTYTYTIPASFKNIPCVVKNCQVAVFVSQGHQEILSGAVVNAIGGSNRYIGKIEATTDIKQGHPGISTDFTCQATGILPSGSMYKFTLEPVTDLEGWDRNFTINGTQYTNSATLPLDKDMPLDIAVSIIPGSNAAVGTYRLSMESVTYPSAPARVQEFAVISGITDLVVNGSGGPETTQHQGVYLDGLTAAGCTSVAAISAPNMVKALNNDALSEVKNIFYNVAWTFPSFKDEEAVALKSLMDQGYNVLVAGQDIGWDIMSGDDGSNGNEITRDLYTNYLNAIFKNDGTTANNQITAVKSDILFGNVGNSVVTDVYSGSFYPDQIDTISPAVPIFLYKSLNTKRAALRVEKPNYKAVYFGVGFEMLSTAAVRNDILRLIYEWFNGVITGTEFDKAVAEVMGQNYPNPTNAYTTFPFSNIRKDMIIEVCDMKGRLVTSIPVSSKETQIKVNTSWLTSGQYICNLMDGKKLVGSRCITVSH